MTTINYEAIEGEEILFQPQGMTVVYIDMTKKVDQPTMTHLRTITPKKVNQPTIKFLYPRRSILRSKKATKPFTPHLFTITPEKVQPLIKHLRTITPKKVDPPKMTHLATIRPKKVDQPKTTLYDSLLGEFSGGFML